jgi:hypothetical protein
MRAEIFMANELLECFQWKDTNHKMDVTEKKYPVEKAKGVSTKYDKL